MPKSTRLRPIGALVAVLLVLGTFLQALPARADQLRSAVVALALWDANVFRSEANGAARVLSRRYGGGGPVIVKANGSKSLAAGPRGMMAALAAAERGMQPDRDILFLVLTSHGSPEGIAEKAGRKEGLLSPSALGEALAQSAFRKKVLIVSACYAGIFTQLAGDDTLVITAADASHPSFGCEEGNRWTYFGDAFFNRSLRMSGPIAERFTAARSLIRAREQSQGFEPSNPQIAGGANVTPLLDGSP